MENKEKRLDIAWIGHDIKKLMRLRRISQQELAQKAGISYYLLNKFLSSPTYRTHSGKIKRYKLPHVRRAIASELGVSYTKLWGKEGKKVLRELIADEVLKDKNKRRTTLKGRRRKGVSAFLKRWIRKTLRRLLRWI